MVDLLLEVLRVSKLGSHITIVGEQEHTCGITVKPAYRIDALRTSVLHEIHHSLTLLRII